MHHLLLHEVSAHFQGGESRSVRVGIEHELLARDTSDGSVVSIDRVQRAIRGSSYESWVGFEPGGQVELSLPCSPTLPHLADRWQTTIEQLCTDCATAGIQLDPSPVDDRPVPRQLANRRYVEMERHFDRLCPAGRRMMRRTASTQVCLDWWPGAAGLEQWLLALAIAPFMAAAFARSSGQSSRLATWFAVDPSRTAYDERLLWGDDPVAAYADFAAGATVFGMPGDDSQGVSFSTWALTHGVTNAAVHHHLSTLFPPVRPRGRYLEMRFLDVQPHDLVVPVAALLSRLLYDDDVRRLALRLLQDDGRRQVDRWEQAALVPESLADTSSALLSLAGWSVPTLVDVA